MEIVLQHIEITALTQYERYSIFNEKNLSVEIAADGLEGDYRMLIKPHDVVLIELQKQL
ncbi:hypothetical protein G9F72_006625 [Clostridium estertheticum]|uniref:hypothetical protein n=1 Tax=Clostridium estertheticum TaxID=238834 RepID=UPI001CD0981C|nr:hypothetical protein [Clostridium estertheticum]MBZ9686008.1 hypothetical protein [Clostridium estertheticum]